MAKDERGLSWDQPDDQPTLRKNYLFVIGIDQYQHLPRLNNARRDAEAVAKVLTEHYDCEVAGFAPPLFDEKATRSNLDQRFRTLAREFKKQEYQHNLLIYFAGHGEWDEDFETGYWALHGAKEQDLSTYYSNSDLVTAIRAIKSHHTLIISDSCFSGGLIDSSPRRSNRKESQRSRYVLASGLKDETVSDGAAGTHSPFAESIINFLEEKRGKEFRVTQLEDYIEELFRQKKLNQEPIFAPLNVPDNQYGQLWLRPRFDVVQELDRLLEGGDLTRLEEFIRVKADDLRKRKQLNRARTELENLAWAQAKEAHDGPIYLAYLKKYLHTRNQHPEEALGHLQLWLERQQGKWKEAEEDVAYWQEKYQHTLKNKEATSKQANQIAALQQEVKELEERLTSAQETQQEQAEVLRGYQDALHNLGQEETEWKIERESLLQQIQTLKQKQTSPPKVKQPPKPRFDFPVPEMIPIQGGTFRMGSNENDREKPIHEVTLDSFELGKYPVTQAEWKAVMGDNPSHFRGNDLPVEQVSWDECQVFIQKLNEKTGLKYRLPTEAEWEYAAGGGKVDRLKWAGTDSEAELDDYAWYSQNSNKQTHSVGQKKPNPLGLHDMSGNVWEWCQDWYGDYPSEPQTNPAYPGDGDEPVRRGGSCAYDATGCRVAYREWGTPNSLFRKDYPGFRLARKL